MLEQMIADAEKALHAIYLGRQAVKVTIEGQETEFNRASAPALEAYIDRLKARLASESGAFDRGAVGFVF